MAIDATVAPLDDYVGKIPTEGVVVIVTSTYNGTPPDNAARFRDRLERDGLGADSLREVNHTESG